VRKAFQKKPIEQLRYLVERFRADLSTLMVGHRLRPTFDRARALHEKYEIRPYPGRITILLASDSRHGQRPQQDPRLAWGRLALDGMDYHVLPGDHHSMLHEHTDDLADKLRECLAAATAQPARANHQAAETL
jgi:thioesterase domain-containing protein